MFFLWYFVDVLDAKKMYSFNGHATFIKMLIGSIEVNRLNKNSDKLFVRRIKHPLSENKNDYSYALHSPAYGTLSDGSGWILFLDCCNDFSGSGGY